MERVMPKTVPSRSKLDRKFTWNAESVFPSNEAWEKEVNQILEDISTVKGYQGRLAETPSVLLDALTAYDKLVSRAQVALMYAGFSYAVDTTNQQAAGMNSKAQGMYGQVASAVSFLQPEILQIGNTKLDEWMSQSENLALYKHSFDDLFRRQAHVRSADAPEILGLAGDPLSGPYNSTSMLTNADFKFKPIKDSKGKVIDVVQGNYDTRLMHLADRKARKAAYRAASDKYPNLEPGEPAKGAHRPRENVFYMRA